MIVKYLGVSLINLRNSIDGKRSDFTTCIKLVRQQMLQIFPIALALVKTVSTSEKSLNEIRQIIYSSCQIKETTEKVYNNINL